MNYAISHFHFEFEINQYDVIKGSKNCVTLPLGKCDSKIKEVFEAKHVDFLACWDFKLMMDIMECCLNLIHNKT